MISFFEVLKHFNLGDKFISWIQTIYSDRRSYVIINGFLTTGVDINRGIFQGCPISPYVFLFIMETVDLATRQNDNIEGISIKKNICWQMI